MADLWISTLHLWKRFSIQCLGVRNVSASSQFAQCGFQRGEVSQCFNSFEIPAAIKLQAFECQSENLSKDFKGTKEDSVGLNTCGLFPSQTFEHETVVP